MNYRTSTSNSNIHVGVGYKKVFGILGGSTTSLEGGSLLRRSLFHDHTITDRAAIEVDRCDVHTSIRYGDEGDAPFFGYDQAKKWRKVGVR